MARTLAACAGLAGLAAGALQGGGQPQMQHAQLNASDRHAQAAAGVAATEDTRTTTATPATATATTTTVVIVGIIIVVIFGIIIASIATGYAVVAANRPRPDPPPGLLTTITDPDPPPGLLTTITDPDGKTLDLHAACVLKDQARFKGAVWADLPPSGVVMFHNSGFSNWYPHGAAGGGGRFSVVHDGRTITFGNSEAVIMAVKERIASDRPLQDCLAKHAVLSGKDSKEEAKKAGNPFPLWGDHTFQVLLGASACLLKFSQDGDLQKALLATGSSVLVETAPNDGSWGVAKNSSDFLKEEEKPEDYTLQSMKTSEISFTVGPHTIPRKRCEANALGKALTLTRGRLSCDSHVPVTSLPVALEMVLQELGQTQGVTLAAVAEKTADLRRLFEGEAP